MKVLPTSVLSTITNVIADTRFELVVSLPKLAIAIHRALEIRLGLAEAATDSICMNTAKLQHQQCQVRLPMHLKGATLRPQIPAP